VVLAQTVPFLPPAVHVAVVDPGVGTSRRAIAVAAGASVFVGPDNGLLSWAVAACGGAVRAVSLTNRALWREPVAAATFHGRDIFMPVAAHLAAGTGLEAAGQPVEVADLVRLPVPERTIRDSVAEGEVLTVDRFGNIQLTITAADAAEIGVKPGGTVLVSTGLVSTGLVSTGLIGSGRHRLAIPYRDMFGAVAAGELVAYADSAGLVSIAVNGGNAAQRLALPPGAVVSVTAIR
jgi:S-adenosylmethionine hydrolase